MLNYAMLSGRLTSDPEYTQTDGGTGLCKFSIAVHRPKKKDGTEQEPDFFNCIAWNSMAEVVSKWYKKGDMIIVVGGLKNHKYTKNDEQRTATQVVVKEIHFAGGGAKRPKEPQGPEIDGISNVDIEEMNRIFDREDVLF